MSIRKICKAVVGSGAVILLVFTFTSQLFAQGGTWETKADMPRARWGSAAGVIDDTFYVAGGYNDVAGRHLTWVDAYDPITDTWTSKNPRPRVQSSAAAGVVDGILYTAGGVDWIDSIADTWAYDPMPPESWTQKASMSAPRQGSAGGVINGVFYVAGGVLPLWLGGTTVATLEAYDPAANSWTTKTQMPTKRASMAAGVVNDILYVAGGHVGGNPLATLEAYDPATNSWTTLSPMPTARYNSVAGVIDGIVYVVGGRDMSDAFATIEAYDPVTDTWSTMDPMPTARVDSVSAVINGQLYVAGGYTSVPAGNVGVSTLEAFTPGEPDSDGDGVPDDEDAFPDDASEWSDNDGDGIGDNADTDDDNDGLSDDEEAEIGTDPNLADTDGDGVDDGDDPFPLDGDVSTIEDFVVFLRDDILSEELVADEYFKNPKMRRPLQNKLTALIDLVREADSAPDDLTRTVILLEAIDKLEDDIIAKTDGWSGGNPKNDWIVSAEVQELILLQLDDLWDALIAEL